MDYSNFFYLGHGWATRYYWLTTIKEDNKPIISIENLIKKGRVIFDTKTGTTPGDIVGSTWALNFFSERFVNLLKENNIKSYKAYPINFKSKSGINMKYYYLELDHFVSEIIIEGKGKHNLHIDEKGKITKHGQKGLYFNLKEWDGSDIFGIKGTLHIIITKKLKELIERVKLKNIAFESLEEYESGYYGETWEEIQKRKGKK